MLCLKLPLTSTTLSHDPLMPINSRSKGKRGEYEFRDFLRGWFPEAERGTNQSRSGSDGADVEKTPFWPEAKVGALPNVRAALKQAAEATDGRPVIVRVRDDRKQPFYAMPESTLTFLLSKAFPQTAEVYCTGTPAHDAYTRCPKHDL